MKTEVVWPGSPWLSTARPGTSRSRSETWSRDLRRISSGPITVVELATSLSGVSMRFAVTTTSSEGASGAVDCA